MRTLTKLRPFSPAVPWLAALVLIDFQAGTAAAQRYATDPVEELRQALQIKVNDPVNNPDELKFRDRNLQKSVAALRSIGDLRRALELPTGWRDAAAESTPDVMAIDRKYRSQIADRFRDDLRAMMKSGNALAQMAAADLLDGVGVTIRGSDPPRDKGGLASVLGSDLLPLLKSNDPRVREAATRALGKINTDPAVAAPVLGQILRSPDEQDLHRAAATSLADMIQVVASIQGAHNPSGVSAEPEDVVNTAKHVVPMLDAGLKDVDPRVRRQALEGVRQAAAAIGQLLKELPKADEAPPPGRKLSDSERTYIIGYRDEVEKERALLMPIATALRALAPSLRQTLRDSDEQNRLAASRALEEVGNSHMRLLRRALSVPPLPSEAAPQQGRIPEQLRPSAEFVHQIHDAKNHAASAVVSARLLVALQKPVELKADDPLQELILAELPAMAENLGEADVRLRLSTMNVVETLGGEAYRAEALLMRAMEDPNRFVRWTAVRILGKTKPIPDAVPGLAKRLSDPDLGVRLAATATAENYGEAARAAVPALARDVTRGDAEVREAAIRTIANLGPDVAGATVPALAQGLFDRDVRVRRAAAEALGRFGAAAQPAESALRRALEHDDPEERRAVSEALLSILQKPKPTER